MEIVTKASSIFGQMTITQCVPSEQITRHFTLWREGNNEIIYRYLVQT